MGKIINRGGVTWRSIVLGLLLIPVNVFWTTIIEVRWYALDGTCLPLFIIPIFLLFLLVMANLAVARRWPNSALNQGELLIVYIMVVTSGVMASHDLFQNMFGTIGHPYRYATADNRWRSLFIEHLPQWLLVKDQNALQAFYQGGVNPYQGVFLIHWIVPLLGWTALMFVLIGMMLCVNVLIRKQWTQNEKLVFPLVQLPIAMTEKGGRTKFYKNKMMWAGFSVAFLIGTINGLHHLYPAFPQIQGVKAYEISQHFVTHPWNAMGYTSISMYPFAIGIAYFMPLDLSFSCWFFFVARLLLRVVGAMYGWNSGSNADFPYFNEQASGAWLMLAIVVLWGTRKFLADAFRLAIGRKGTHADPTDVGAYRGAFIGMGVGIIILGIFSNVMGLSALVALGFFGIYFLLAVAMTRVRAELGTPHEIYFVNPARIMVSAFGASAFGAGNLSVMSLMFWFNRCYRSHPMPNQLEAFKMMEGTNTSRGRLVGVLVLATVFGTLVTYWANLHVTYDAGAMAKCLGFKQWVGWEAFEVNLLSWLQSPQPATPGGLAIIFGKWLSVRLEYMFGGALFVMALTALRGAFLWWPLHPAGYALAVSFAMDYFWFAFFVSWLLKVLIVRYGGMRLHNAAVPFFLGLILGDFLVGSLWAIIGPLLGMQTYKVFI